MAFTYDVPGQAGRVDRPAPGRVHGGQCEPESSAGATRPLRWSQVQVTIPTVAASWVAMGVYKSTVAPGARMETTSA